MDSELLERVLLAHGGLDQWNRFDIVGATIVTGGQLFGIKGVPQDPTPRRMTLESLGKGRSCAKVLPEASCR